MADVTFSLWQKVPYYFVDDDDLPPAVVNALDDELSYRPEGYQYSTSWKEGDWDGYVNLFKQSSNDSWFFGVGSLPRVVEVLDAFSLTYEVKGVSRPESGDMGYSWNTDMELRDYQDEAVDEAIDLGHGVIVLPTGAGKTICGIAIAHRLDLPLMVTCDKIEVADQWVDELGDILDVDVSRYYGGDKENGDVMVALYQAVHDDNGVADDVRMDHEIIMPDECHSVAAKTFKDVVMESVAPYRYGFSATPEREDGKTPEIIDGIGPIIADLSAETLIESGYLAEPEWDIREAPKAGGNYRTWQAEYQGEIVENDRRNRLIADIVEDLRRPTLVTVERINHGERLSSLIPNAAFVHGDATNRDAIINGFRNGHLPVMVATRGIVGEGFNVENIGSFVLAGGMKSETSTIQQIGRALRPGESGKATIVDFIDYGRWIGRHSEQRIRTMQNYYQSYGP